MILSIRKRHRDAGRRARRYRRIMDVPEVVVFGVGPIVATGSERTRVLPKMYIGSAMREPL